MSKCKQRLPILVTALAILVLAGSASRAAPGLPELRVSDNGRFLVTEEGEPFFWLADTAWMLFTRPDHKEVELYLADRSSKGFTVVQAVIAFYGLKNRYGRAAFRSTDPPRPNEKYFENVDYVVNKAEEHGLYVGVLPIWAASSVRPEGRLFNLSNTDTARDYGRFLGRRYRDKPVVWILGGDWPGGGLEPIWQAMAEGLKEGDGDRHLITYHPRGGQHSATWFHNEPWLDFNMTQSGHSIHNRNYEMITADYARRPAKPVIDGEPGYEHITDGLKKDGPGVPKLGDWDVRRFAYCAVFAGAAGHTYGCSEVYQFWEPGMSKERWGSTMPWQEALQLPGAAQMQHLRWLIESRPMLLRVPDQSLIGGDVGRTIDRVQATRASDGSYAFIYIAAGRPVTIRTDKLSGRELLAWWYDPRTGRATRIGRLEKSPTRQFVPPSTGRGNDWVLVLDDAAKGLPAPGHRK